MVFTRRSSHLPLEPVVCEPFIEILKCSLVAFLCHAYDEFGQGFVGHAYVVVQGGANFGHEGQGLETLDGRQCCGSHDLLNCDGGIDYRLFTYKIGRQDDQV